MTALDPVGLCPWTGKRRFPSATFARRYCRRAGNTFRAYRCDGCGGWHITKERGRGEEYRRR